LQRKHQTISAQLEQQQRQPNTFQTKSLRPTTKENHGTRQHLGKGKPCLQSIRYFRTLRANPEVPPFLRSKTFRTRLQSFRRSHRSVAGFASFLRARLDNVLCAILTTEPSRELLIRLRSKPDSHATKVAGEVIIYKQHPAFPQIWCPSVGRRTHLVGHVGATILATRKARLDSFREFDYIGHSGVHKFLKCLTRVGPNAEKMYICQPPIQDFRITYSQRWAQSVKIQSRLKISPLIGQSVKTPVDSILVQSVKKDVSES
jgi:hypothetical protein